MYVLLNIKQSFIDHSKLLNIISILHHYINQTQNVLNITFESNK